MKRRVPLEEGERLRREARYGNRPRLTLRDRIRRWFK